MPTDEQRKRFEKWAEGIDMAPDFAAEREKCPDDPTYGWNYGKLTAWEAWQARDAEVQALREALKIISDSHGWEPSPQDLQDIARAALAGGETGETE